MFMSSPYYTHEQHKQEYFTPVSSGPAWRSLVYDLCQSYHTLGVVDISQTAARAYRLYGQLASGRTVNVNEI